MKNQANVSFLIDNVREFDFMRTKRIALASLLIFMFSLVSACGTTGNTSRFVVDLDRSQSPQATSEIRVVSASMDDNAAHLIAVKVKPWGKFSTDDLRNIEETLRISISPHLLPTTLETDKRLDLHLVIRRYIVSTSNTGGAVLVCVAWAATNSVGKVIFEEEFYASGYVYHFGTVGLMKDFVHNAIVRRIATTALALTYDPKLNTIDQSYFENTSTSFKKATSNLPKSMTSLGNPYVAVGASGAALTTIGLLTPSGTSIVNWEMANSSENFNWQGYLETFYSSPKHDF